MLATSGADNSLAVWDLALERDPEEEEALAPEGNAVPQVRMRVLGVGVLGFRCRGGSVVSHDLLRQRALAHGWPLVMAQLTAAQLGSILLVRSPVCAPPLRQPRSPAADETCTLTL
jgi:hypothetical protein